MIRAIHISKLEVYETIEIGADSADVSLNTIVHGGNWALNEDVGGDLFAAFTVDIIGSAGIETLDLTALIGTNGAAVDGTTYAIQSIKFQADDTNAAPITVTIGALNGCDGLGATFSLDLNPGADMLMKVNGATQYPVVDATHKTFDFIGAGSVRVAIVFITPVIVGS